MLFLYGKGVEKNDEQAIKYFETSANLGSARAFNKLAYLYLTGEILEKNPKKALEFFEIAASKNYVSSYFPLALMHENGKGIVYFFLNLFLFYSFFIY
jgi:TPR repeat protein